MGKHILMIAPQPYFQFRGTPFSIRERLRALTSLGHTVDLLTYHIGQEVEIEGVRVHRSFPIPFLDNVRIGPSWVKFPLDFLLAIRSLFLLPFLSRIDMVHSHEEGALIGCMLAKLLRKPHVYDMHSSLPQQLVNYEFTKPGFLLTLARKSEEWIIKNSSAVIVVCPWLKDVVHGVSSRTPVFLIENPPICPPAGPDTSIKAASIRTELGLDGKDIVVYTGTFEINQGLEIVLGAIPLIVDQHPKTSFLFIGGEPDQVAALREKTKAAGVEDFVILLGQKPPEDMPVYMELASILISPRKVGQNTPLKIYSYLQSGRPIVATNLETHTQVLDDRTAILVDPEPQAMAEGILTVLKDSDLANAVGQAGKEMLDERYSWDRFVDNTSTFTQFMKEL